MQEKSLKINVTAAPNAEGAKALLAYLATPQSRAIFKQHGID